MEVLPEARPFTEWLDGLGCRTLGDLRRLPRAGQQGRCGGDIVAALDRAHREAPEIFTWAEAPPAFDAAVDLPDRLENAEAALAYACGLLVQMVGWLTASRPAIRSSPSPAARPPTMRACWNCWSRVWAPTTCASPVCRPTTGPR